MLNIVRSQKSVRHTTAGVPQTTVTQSTSVTHVTRVTGESTSRESLVIRNNGAKTCKKHQPRNRKTHILIHTHAHAHMHTHTLLFPHLIILHLPALIEGLPRGLVCHPRAASLPIVPSFKVFSRCD